MIKEIFNGYTQADLVWARKLIDDAIKASVEFGGFRENLAIMIAIALTERKGFYR